MKKVFLSLALFVSASAIFAQSPISIGKSQFNAGLGLSSWGVPVYLGLDYGVHPDITVGGEMSFRSYSDSYEHKDYNHTVIGLSGNGNYHLNRLLDIPREWDLYAGLNLGFYMWNSPSDYHGSHTSGLGLGAQVGGRYYFNSKFGVNFEIGGANAFSGGKVGISIRL